MSSTFPTVSRAEAGVASARAERTSAHGFEIITVAFKSRPPLERLLAILPSDVVVTVVDNSRETEELSDLVAARPGTAYIDSGGNIGFGAACNLGVRAATMPYVILLNPDTEPTADVFNRLVDSLDADDSVACCGPALVTETGAPQRGAGGWQPTVLRALAHAIGLDHVLSRTGIWLRSGREQPLEVEWLAGTCLVIRRDAFLRVGGFDPRYFLYQEDMDLGRRLRAHGFRQLVRGDVKLVHDGGASSPTEARLALWTYRASALGTYLRTHSSPFSAFVMRYCLSAGYLLRALVFAAMGNRAKRTEMLTYGRGLSRDVDQRRASPWL